MGRPKQLKESVPSLWRILCFFWPWVRKQRPLIASGMVALMAGIFFRLLEPWPLKFIFDRIIPTERPPRLKGLELLDQIEPMTLLTLSAVALVAIVGMRAFADYCQKVGFAKIGNRVLRDVRNDLYRHIQGLSLAFHTRARSGDLIVRVTRDVGLLRDVTSTAILPLIASVVLLAGMVVIMLLMQWKLALLAMTTIPLFWISTIRISRGIRDAARKQRLREGAMASTAAESIVAIKIVQALSLEGIFAEDFSSLNAKSQKEDLKAARLSAKLGRTVDVLLALSTAMVLWYGARLVIHSQMTPGDLLVFLTYLKRAFRPAKDFAKYTGRLAKASAAGERVMELLKRTPEIQDSPDAIEAPHFRGEVAFRGVNFEYHEDRPVLREIDFLIQPGRHVALAGPSGVGKSTLASLILRLYDPVEGSVMIDGRDIREYTLTSLRSQISAVLQDSVLFAASVWDNIGYGVPGATQEEIVAAARLANAHEFILNLPQGYETIVGERGASLSHGQRQRIAIARAAIRKVPILILDEPTTGLDEENERAVIEALRRLAKGRTTFLISHDLQLTALADEVLYLEGGRLCEHGSHDELMRAGGRYASLYRLQTAEESRA